MFNSALIYELACLKVYAEPLLFGIAKERSEYLEANRLLKFFDYFVPVPSEECRIIPCFGNLLEEAALIPDRSRFNILKFNAFQSKGIMLE